MAPLRERSDVILGSAGLAGPASGLIHIGNALAPVLQGVSRFQKISFGFWSRLTQRRMQKAGASMRSFGGRTRLCLRNVKAQAETGFVPPGCDGSQDRAGQEARSILGTSDSQISEE